MRGHIFLARIIIDRKYFFSVICTTESKLKRIKNEFRSTMGETRLNLLYKMSFKSEVFRDHDLSSINETFACQRTERLVFEH